MKKKDSVSLYTFCRDFVVIFKLNTLTFGNCHYSPEREYVRSIRGVDITNYCSMNALYCLSFFFTVVNF